MSVRARLATLGEPSLARRLVAAQAVAMVLVWCLAAAFVVVDAARGDSAFDPGALARRADMILAAAEQLDHDPAGLAAVLGRIDRFQRGETGIDDDPGLRVGMQVWLGGRLVFRSPGLPGPVRVRADNVLERHASDATQWRVYARSSPSGRARVVLLQGADIPASLAALATGRMFLLPLILSFPFLIVIAWLSVRSALRPWGRLVAEVRARTPDDLRPLRFVARHRELKPLTQAIDTLLARVRAAAAREQQFIADAAHELRTPLAALQVHVEALQGPAGAARQGELIHGIARSAARAGRLVTQLLSLMRREARPAQACAAVISLTDLVQERLAELSCLADRRAIELDLRQDGPARVMADAEGLVSLVDNLLDNAIKYAPAGSTIQVTVHDGNEMHELIVDDQGPGIAPAYRERVKSRFFRMPDQAQSGSGLGLAIVEAVCLRHGARLRLEDGTRGGGLAARVSWPAAEHAGSGAGAP